MQHTSPPMLPHPPSRSTQSSAKEVNSRETETQQRQNLAEVVLRESMIKLNVPRGLNLRQWIKDALNILMRARNRGNSSSAGITQQAIVEYLFETSNVVLTVDSNVVKEHLGGYPNMLQRSPEVLFWTMCVWYDSRFLDYLDAIRQLCNEPLSHRDLVPLYQLIQDHVSRTSATPRPITESATEGSNAGYLNAQAGARYIHSSAPALTLQSRSRPTSNRQSIMPQPQYQPFVSTSADMTDVDVGDDQAAYETATPSFPYTSAGLPPQMSFGAIGSSANTLPFQPVLNQPFQQPSQQRNVRRVEIISEEAAPPPVMGSGVPMGQGSFMPLMDPQLQLHQFQQFQQLQQQQQQQRRTVTTARAAAAPGMARQRGGSLVTSERILSVHQIRAPMTEAEQNSSRQIPRYMAHQLQ